jgi:hypothetical protein
MPAWNGAPGAEIGSADGRHASNRSACAAGGQFVRKRASITARIVTV